jgi:hypothetical protein
VIVLSDAAGNVMLDSVGEMLNGGHIELLTGNGGVIATLQLSNPAAMAAADRELEFNRIAEGDAALTGQAEFARGGRQRGLLLRCRHRGQRCGHQARHHANQRRRPGAAQ